jgi:peptidoglycan/xylan/chitin deacetylase (PgdA/CDA1 family)
MKITLTFDNGPTTEVTPRVLDVLARQALKVTFFVMGRNLEDPEAYRIAERAAREGHRIGNHSYSHHVPLGLMEDPEEAVREISRTEHLLGELAGTEFLFRPFGRAKIGPHLLNQRAWDYLVEHQYSCMLWSCVTPERDQPDRWFEIALATCRSQSWSVVALHDIPTGAMRHLDHFISALKSEGAEFTSEFPDELTPLRRGIVQKTTLQLVG